MYTHIALENLCFSIWYSVSLPEMMQHHQITPGLNTVAHTPPL